MKLLVAFPYWDEKMATVLRELPDDVELVLDSGAFTAWKQGTEIKLDDYCRFIDICDPKPVHYFTLDVIGDPEGTLANYDEMRARGYNPVPVFTRGDDLDQIDRYYETSDILALGGLVGTKGNRGFVRGAMERVGDRKVHWLGFNYAPMLAYYKPHMCDSSSWMAGFRYGNARVYAGRGKWKSFSRQSFKDKPDRQVLELIKSYLVDPSDLARAEQWRKLGHAESALEVLLCRSWVRYQRDVHRQLGVNFYLAVSTMWKHVARMVEARRLYLEGKLQ